MTREEAAKILKLERDSWRKNPKLKVDQRLYDALDVAIKALEQKPCEDCISREELLKAIDTWDKFGCDADNKLIPVKDCYVPYIHYDDVVKCVKGLPSVNPKSKTGHWIDGVCSECGYIGGEEVFGGEFKYCPVCGTVMGGEHEND